MMRQNLLSLRLLHLLSRCTVLSGRCLVSLLSLARRMSTQRVIGHPPHNLYLLRLWVTYRVVVEVDRIDAAVRTEV